MPPRSPGAVQILHPFYISLPLALPLHCLSCPSPLSSLSAASLVTSAAVSLQASTEYSLWPHLGLILFFLFLFLFCLTHPLFIVRLLPFYHFSSPVLCFFGCITLPSISQPRSLSYLGKSPSLQHNTFYIVLSFILCSYSCLYFALAVLSDPHGRAVGLGQGFCSGWKVWQLTTQH